MVVHVSTVIDTLERQGAQLDFLRGTTLRIQEADTADRAIQQMIESVCRFAQWPAGHAYRLSGDGQLERPPLWYLRDSERLASFRKSIEELPPSDGIGLAQRVLDLGEPQWTRGLCESRHASIARAAEKVGITTAFAFPIFVNLETKAILEFFSQSDDAPEPAFLEIMSTLCIQLGRTLERQRAAELEMTNRELIAANARLQQALAAHRKRPQTEDQESSRFLTNMGHEFRTPLTAILGFSELLLAEADSTGQAGQVDDLNRIHDAASQLLELVDGIIDLSRTQRQEMEPRVEAFEVAAHVRELSDSMRAGFREKGNAFEARCPGDIGSMHTDAQKLRQCLKQLLTNANKYTENGSIQLTVSRLQAPAGDRIVFRISDTGIGMTQEQVSRLFRPFSQADSSAARRHGGAGLGLALTQNLAQLLGGSVRVESVLGEGTVCFLELPSDLEPRTGSGDTPTTAPLLVST